MRWVFFLLLCVLAYPASALDNSRPESLLQEIYERYRGVGAGLDIAGSEAQRVLDPALFVLIRKDRNAALRGTGVLNYDPICDCQDYDVTEPVISVTNKAENEAAGVVSFKNFGRAFSVSFGLQRGADGWRITNVRSASTPSLRAALSAKAVGGSAADLKRIGVPARQNGLRYILARQRLLAAGWQPYRSRDADGCPPGDRRCRGFPEVESCSGTGEANCVFLWRRSGRIIEISTVDEPAMVAAVSCRSNCGMRR